MQGFNMSCYSSDDDDWLRLLEGGASGREDGQVKTDSMSRTDRDDRRAIL